MTNARETPKGFRVKMWGKQQHFPHAFLKGGHFPYRKRIKSKGNVPHAFQRVESSGRQMKPLAGIAAAESMGKQKNLDNLVILAHERIEANLKRLLQRAIDGKKYSKK